MPGMGNQRAKLASPGISRLSITPEVGSTEHIMLLLVLAEVALLIIIRRVFSAAHGG